MCINYRLYSTIRLSFVNISSIIIPILAPPEVILETALSVAQIWESIMTVIIDTTTAPSNNKVWRNAKMESHLSHGNSFELSTASMSLYEATCDQYYGWGLKRDLLKQPILNVCVRDHLLQSPELIPAGWRGKWPIYFFGTVYSFTTGPSGLAGLVLGYQFVCGLKWTGKEWVESTLVISSDHLGRAWAAVRNSGAG